MNLKGEGNGGVGVYFGVVTGVIGILGEAGFVVGVG